MKLRSAVITTNPRSYEVTLNEFPDLFPAFKEPDNQFPTSSYHALRISSSLQNPTFGILDIGKRVVFTHTFGGITLTQIYIFLRELNYFIFR